LLKIYRGYFGSFLWVGVLSYFFGVHVQSAVACGITSKGPWRSAKTPGINQALSNDYLKSEGLYSLRDGWIKLHYPK
jgi:RNA-directed DNA polymerase